MSPMVIYLFWFLEISSGPWISQLEMRWTCLTGRDYHRGWRGLIHRNFPQVGTPKVFLPSEKFPLQDFFFFFAYLTFSSHSYISPQALSGLHNLPAPIPGLQHTEAAVALPGASILFPPLCLFHFIYLCIYLLTWCVGTCMPLCSCGGQRTAYGSQFSFPAMWVSVVKFRPVHLAANTFT